MANMDAAARCQHIMDTGLRCKAPALHNFDFCFWHQRDRQPKSSKPLIPVLESANSIQLVITSVLRQLQDGTMDPRRATAMFYGLQLAQVNAKNVFPRWIDVVHDLTP